MGLLGPHPLAVLLCKCSDQTQEPQPRAFFEAYFTRIDPRRWADAFWIVDPAVRSTPPGGGIAAVARLPDQLDVFWIADDGAIWSTWWNGNHNNGRWNAPFPITGANVAPPGGHIAAVARRPNHLDVFWADNGGAIGTHWWNGEATDGGWHQHQAFRITGTNVVPPGGAVAVVSRLPDHLDVFWADNGGAIGTQWWNGQAPNGGWNQHPAFRITDPNVVPPGGGVAAVARRSDHLDVFWADNGGAVGTQWWNGQAPNGPWDRHPAFRITGVGVVPPGGGVAAVARHPDHLDVFWIDSGGAIGTHWWNGQAADGNWDRHPAFRISSPKAAPPGGHVAASARRPDHLDVFWADYGGAVGTNWWDAGANNGAWNVPFRISEPNAVPAGGCVAGVARFAEHLDIFWADARRGIASNYWPGPSLWGLAKYWSDLSYRQFDIDGSKVIGWITMPETQAQFLAKNRGQKIDACIAASGINVADYFTVVAIPNVIADSGSSGGRAILDPAAWTLGWAAHETGHCLGLDHSFDDAPASCSPANDGRPGAYSDGWDIMSFACYGGLNPMFASAATFGASGPGLNAPYRDKLGWMPGNRILELDAGHAFQGTVTLACLDKPEAAGHLMVKLFPFRENRGEYYTLEFRRAEGWDQGIPGDAVLIHLVKDGLSYLLRQSGGPERRPGHHLDVFWPDSGAAIGSNWWDDRASGAAWNTAFRITGVNVLPPVARVAAVSRRPNLLDVFWADNGGAIGTQWWSGDATNGAWNQHPAFRITNPNVAPPGAGVAAVARQPDHLDVFWADNGGAIGTQWWNGLAAGGAWDQHSAFRITNIGIVPPGAGVAVVARYPEHLDVFWADNGGAIGSQWWDGQSPNGGWNAHAAFRISDPEMVPPGASVAAVARHRDQLDVFWVGTDGAVWTTWWNAHVNNGRWNQPFPITAANVAPPGGGVAAAARRPDHLDVFWADAAGAIGTHWWNGQAQDGAWDRHPPFRITNPGIVSPGANVSAVSRHPDHLDVFWANNRGAIEAHWWDGQEPNGAWDRHATIELTSWGAVASATGVAAVARYPDHFSKPEHQLSIKVQRIDLAASTAMVEIVFG